MRLVGIAGLQRQACGRGVPPVAHQPEKALKPKNAIERLWSVAECVLAMSAQGPLAHGKLATKPCNQRCAGWRTSREELEHSAHMRHPRRYQWSLVFQCGLEHARKGRDVA